MFLGTCLHIAYLVDCVAPATTTCWYMPRHRDDSRKQHYYQPVSPTSKQEVQDPLLSTNVP